MKPITLQQISELPPSERRRFKIWANKYVGILYAAQQRRKRIRMELEKEKQDEH